MWKRLKKEKTEYVIMEKKQNETKNIQFER